MDIDDFLAAAEGLLAIPSTASRPEELTRALEYVLDLVGPGFTVERFERNGRPSALLYTGAQRPRFRVVLNGHLDVVPAPPEQFVPRRDGTRLYARGAADMKVSALVLALVFAELAGSLPYPLGLQLVTDEEVGGRDGTRYQLEQGVAAEFALIGEQSGLRVVTDSKGLLAAELLATGRAGHGAYPWLSDNALTKLFDSLQRLLGRYPPATEELWRTTVTVSRIETSNRAFNQVPADARAYLDIRFPPEDPDLADHSIEEVAGYLGGFCSPGVHVRIDHLDPPHHADQGRPEVLRLQQVAREQGYSGDFLRKHGAADGRFYYQRGTDAVIFGIGGYDQHGPDEYADVTTIAPYRSAVRAFLLDLPTA